MPEEQAFCVLVKIMFDYGMRDLFKQNFEELHLKFYQLERLMQVCTPERWLYVCCWQLSVLVLVHVTIWIEKHDLFSGCNKSYKSSPNLIIVVYIKFLCYIFFTR